MVRFKKYLYSRSKFTSTQDSLLKAYKQIKTKTYLDDEIPAERVVFYTNFI